MKQKTVCLSLDSYAKSKTMLRKPELWVLPLLQYLNCSCLSESSAFMALHSWFLWYTSFLQEPLPKLSFLKGWYDCKSCTGRQVLSSGSVVASPYNHWSLLSFFHCSVVGFFFPIDSLFLSDFASSGFYVKQSTHLRSVQTTEGLFVCWQVFLNWGFSQEYLIYFLALKSQEFSTSF